MSDPVFHDLRKTNSEDFRHKSTSEMLVISEGFQRMELSIESLTLQMGTAHVIEVSVSAHNASWWLTKDLVNRS